MIILFALNWNEIGLNVFVVYGNGWEISKEFETNKMLLFKLIKPDIWYII